MDSSVQGPSSGRRTNLLSILLVTLAISQVIAANPPCASTNCIRLNFIGIRDFSVVTSLLTTRNISKVDQLNITLSSKLLLKREDFEHPALRELQVLDLESNNITSLDPKLFGVLETVEPEVITDDVDTLISDLFAGVETTSVAPQIENKTEITEPVAGTTTELPLKENNPESTDIPHEEVPVTNSNLPLDPNNTETSTIKEETPPVTDTTTELPVNENNTEPTTHEETATVTDTTTEVPVKENNTEPTTHEETSTVMDTTTEVPIKENRTEPSTHEETSTVTDTTTELPVKENNTEPTTTHEETDPCCDDEVADPATELQLPKETTTEIAAADPDHEVQADQPTNDPNIVVKKLSNLTSLNLRDNKLETIEPNSFQGLPILSTLLLSENRISSIEEHMFKDLVFLSKLDLSDNSISNIDSKSFQTNRKLHTLLLSGNFLQGFDSNLFDHNEELKLLDLSFNIIQDIANFPLRINSLQTLNLKGCLIKTIPFDFFSNLPNLRLMNLKGNKLERIETGLFTSAPNLRMILLEDNALKSLSVNAFQEFYPILKEVSSNGEGLLEDSYGVSMYEGNPWDCTTRDMIALRLWFRNKPIPGFDKIFKCRLSGTVVNRVTNVVRPITNIFGGIGK